MKHLLKTLGIALLFVALLADIRAQTTPSVVTMQSAATATGNGTAIVIGTSAAAPGANLGAVGIQITGTFSATVTFEATTDGSNWTAVMATNLNDDSRATTATAAGHYTILYGSAIRVRARISSYSSGSVTITGRLIPGLTARLTSGGGGGGSGTVTSVAQTFTGGLISVGGSPVTTSGTLALTVAGTSGGIPYFSSGSTWASSGALTANALVIGGGAGAAPSTTTTGTGVLTALAVNVGSAGAFVVNGGALGTPSSLTLTNATGLPPTTGISGWPANASGVLTNNGSGTLSWVAAPTGANPTASVGLSAVNGVATTFMRSDGAPALDQGIVPTWTGIHTFNNGVTTGTTTSSGTVHLYNSLTTGTGSYFASSSVTSGSVVNIVSTSTAAASSTLKGLNIAVSGANGTTAQTVTGASISVTNTNATSGTNIGLLSIASGATTFNWAAQFQTGFVGFNLTGQSTGRRAWAFDAGSGSNEIAFRRYSDNFAAAAAAVWSVDNSVTTDTFNMKTAVFLTTSGTSVVSNARTPAQITADQNNYSPGIGSVYRLSSDASRNITGFTTTANTDGAYIELWNVGSQNIVLQNENASSTAANRFTTSTGADLTLSANKCAIGRYDATTSRWRIYLCN